MSAPQCSVASAARTPLPAPVTKDHCQRNDNDCQSKGKQKLERRIGLTEMRPEVENQANKYDNARQSADVCRKFQPPNSNTQEATPSQPYVRSSFSLYSCAD